MQEISRRQIATVDQLWCETWQCWLTAVTVVGCSKEQKDVVVISVVAWNFENRQYLGLPHTPLHAQHVSERTGQFRSPPSVQVAKFRKCNNWKITTSPTFFLLFEKHSQTLHLINSKKTRFVEVIENVWEKSKRETDNFEATTEKVLKFW